MHDVTPCGWSCISWFTEEDALGCNVKTSNANPHFIQMILTSLQSSAVILSCFWNSNDTLIKPVPSTQAPSCFAFLCKVFFPALCMLKSSLCIACDRHLNEKALNLMWKFIPHHITANRTGTHSFCFCSARPWLTRVLKRPIVPVIRSHFSHWTLEGHRQYFIALTLFSCRICFFLISGLQTFALYPRCSWRGKTLWINLQLFTVWSRQLILIKLERCVLIKLFLSLHVLS